MIILLFLQPMNKIIIPFYVSFTIVVVCIVFTVMIMREASALLIPLFAGLLAAILLYPVVIILEKRKLGRFMSALIAVLLFMLVFGIVNYFLMVEIIRFLKELPNLNARLQGMSLSLEQWIAAKFNIDSAQQADYLSSSTKDIIIAITQIARKAFVSFGNLIIWILFVCVYAFFILYYRKLLARFFIRLAENDCPDEMPVIMFETEKVIKSYIAGLLVKVLLLFVLNCLVFLLLGIKYALLLALIAALLSFIPYIGFFIATALAMLVTYANSGGSTAITVGIAMNLIHLVDGIVLLPRIVGSRMKMNPLITVIAIIAGDIVWGVPGMFLFIPLAAMLKIIFENVPSLAAWGILFGEDQVKGEL